MIPKIIHYCWFGNSNKPDSVNKCIESWKKYCPDYKIIEWNESNINIEENLYTRQAYEQKAWGFVPDYLRLKIIYENGGIYLDTDVQVIKSFDPLLKYSAFAGFEDETHVALGLGFGAEKHNKFLMKHMELYDNLEFINNDGSLNRTPSPKYCTELLQQFGLKPNNGSIQEVYGVTVFPQDYFCPKSFETGLTKITENSYSIHQFDGSWCTKDEIEYKKKRWRLARRDYILNSPRRFLRNFLGEKYYIAIKKRINK